MNCALELAVRPAHRGDAPAIADLLDQLGYAHTLGFLPARIEQLVAHPDEALLVAELDGAVPAVISIHFIPQLALAGDFARISYFCVAAGGRSAGIGARLERHCAALARARGCDRIELHCHSRRLDAHRFYARQGYVESPKYLVKQL